MGHPQQQQNHGYPILVSTMNDVPGYKVTHVYGEVFGLTVRSRNMFANIGAGFRSLGGGEIPEYTQMLSDSRYEAVGRLCQAAMAYGANAVIAMRFDCNEIAGTMSEVAAYGTAVFVTPEQGSQGQSTQGQPQHHAQAAQQPAPPPPAPAQPYPANPPAAPQYPSA
ncbi:YbjQ family protein [Pseudonocardiaceae bacterium YIM PH 21723]|nr:YbjQ family protein [Pseudonocardiaceae bacterium YIM PH 21723]